MVTSAMSGIDIALWDIIGKSCGKPIHKLIGGAQRSEVTAYATGLYFIDMERLVEEAVEEARDYVEQGFVAVKMKIGLGDPKLDIRRVAAVREAVGDTTRLMVDANHCFTVPQAIRLGRELEQLNVEWFEEPISPEDIDGYVEVTRALDMAVAGGENEFTRWGFRDLVVRKAMDIVQTRCLRSRWYQRMPQDRRPGKRPRRGVRASCLGLGHRSCRDTAIFGSTARSTAQFPPDASPA